MSSVQPSAAGGPVAAVLNEALDAVATPEIRQTILNRALAVAGFDAIPESGDDVRRFVDQYLHMAVVSTLGEEAAEHVCSSLEPIVQMAEAQEEVSEVRPATPRDLRTSAIPTDAPPKDEPGSDRPTMQADPEPELLRVEVPKASKAPELGLVGIDAPDLPPIELEDLPELPNERPNSEAPEFPDVAELAMETGPAGPVVVCSPLSFVAKALGKALSTKQEVAHTSSEMDLIEWIETNEGPTPVAVIIDCRSETMDVATIAIIVAEQDPSPLLVLWGATPEMREEVGLAAEDLRCLPVPKDCDVHELAARCAAAG